MQEYPLYTPQAARLCPSARYVGAVSGWLCECARPLECEGVKQAPALVFKADALELIGQLSAYVGVGINQGAYVDTVAGPLYPQRLLDKAAQFTKQHKEA